VLNEEEGKREHNCKKLQTIRETNETQQKK